LKKSGIQFRVGSAATIGEFAVDGGDLGEYRPGWFGERQSRHIRSSRPPRRALTVQGAHQDAEIEACDVKIALVDILASAQPSPTHARRDRGYG
jgi:hypothetical protein